MSLSSAKDEDSGTGEGKGPGPTGDLAASPAVITGNGILDLALHHMPLFFLTYRLFRLNA